MNVFINAASANMGGSVTYLSNVLTWLPRVAADMRLQVVAPKATVNRLGPTASGRIQWIPFPAEQTGGWKRMVFDQWQLPALLRRQKADVLFSSTGFGSWKSPVPQVLLVRNSVYFNDTFHAAYRRLGRSLRRNRVRRLHSVWSMKRADIVLFPTEAMAQMTRPYVDLSRKTTAAIQYGYDPASVRLQPLPAALAQRLEALKQVGARLVLSVSTYAVHKNFETLVEALPHLRARDPRIRVVMSTSRDRTSDVAEYDAMERRIEQLGVREMIIETGYLAHGQLGPLYDLADAYVFPSFTESFGHSLVEAMAAGLPVVASDIAVNREICGAAGRYFATFDGEACAQTLLNVLDDPEEQRKARQASVERARQFSWEAYAFQLAALFRSVAGQAT